jgi:nicotinamidase-related amidase
MKPALLVIDMQNWFFRTDERKEHLKRVLPRINELVSHFHRHSLPVFHIVTIHAEDKSTWDSLMKQEDTAVLIEGTPGAEEVSGLVSRDGDRYITKSRYSSFIRTDVEQQLKSSEIDTLFMSGVWLHRCVGWTAIHAYQLDFHVFMAEEATASLDELEGQAIKKALREELKIPVLKNEGILEVLGAEEEISRNRPAFEVLLKEESDGWER